MPALPQELVCSPCLPGSPFSTHRNTQVLPSPPHRTAFLHIPIHASTEHSACSFSSVLFLPSQVLGLLHSCLPAFAWPQLSGVPWENGSEVTDVTVCCVCAPGRANIIAGPGRVSWGLCTTKCWHQDTWAFPGYIALQTELLVTIRRAGLSGLGFRGCSLFLSNSWFVSCCYSRSANI